MEVFREARCMGGGEGSLEGSVSFLHKGPYATDEKHFLSPVVLSDLEILAHSKASSVWLCRGIKFKAGCV